MDGAEMVRALAALAAVLALLGAGLWGARRLGLATSARQGHAARLMLTERIALDQKRSLALVRHGAAEHLLLLAPEGAQLIGEGDEADERPLVIDLAACRILASAAPLAPAPVTPLWPRLKPVRSRPPRGPVHDPKPARTA
jgi:flagellar protein FliO/FliZ